MGEETKNLANKETTKLGRNAENSSSSSSSSETESTITEKQARLFQAILKNTPKGASALKGLSGSEVTYTGTQEIKHASPGTKQKSENKDKSIK